MTSSGKCTEEMNTEYEHKYGTGLALRLESRVLVSLPGCFIQELPLLQNVSIHQSKHGDIVVSGLQMPAGTLK